jgi:HlyD family secretion protein
MTTGQKRLLGIGVAVVVLAVIIIANLMPKKAAKGPEVRAETVKTRKIEAWVRAPGRITPVTQVQVSSNVTGRVAELAVREGQQVEKGELLLRLDDERYRSLVQQFRAQIESGKAQRALAEAEEREAKQNLERTEKLSTEGLASEQQLTAARTRADVTSARVMAAREEVRRADAALEQSEKDLRETVFLAPMPGIVTSLNVEVGENVITGTMNNPGTVILTISDLSAMEVETEVDETDVIDVRVGQPARVLVDALPETTLAGVVTRVGQSGRGRSSAQQEATNFEVAVLLDAPPDVLRPGMNADVEIQTGTRKDALAVPLQALTARPPSVVDRWERKRDPGEDEEDEGDDEEEADDADTTAFADRNLVEGVFLYEDGKARFVGIDLGLRGETHIEVFGDIEEGSTLIVGPYRTLRKLKDNDNVKLDKTSEKRLAKEEKGGDGEENGEDGGSEEEASDESG